MTISSSTRKAGPYSGNASTTNFPFSFKVFQASDVLVVKSDGSTETTLTLTSDYTVSLNADQNANPGGTVTYPASGSPLPVGQTLTLSSAIAETQGTSITNQGGFYPKIIEDALDRLTILVQQIRQVAGRTITFPISDTNPTTTLPPASARVNKALIFDASGNVGVSADNYVDQAASVAANAVIAANAATAAATSQTSAGVSASNAALSKTAAELAASQALYYAQHGTGFAASTMYDLGSVSDPLTIFNTDLGGIP